MYIVFNRMSFGSICSTPTIASVSIGCVSAGDSSTRPEGSAIARPPAVAIGYPGWTMVSIC
jgi:hypothetical protein